MKINFILKHTLKLHISAELGTIKKTIIYPTTIILNTVFEIDAQLTGLYNTRKMTDILTTYID